MCADRTPRLDALAARPLPPVAKKLGRFLMVGGFCTGLQYALLVGQVEGFGMSPTTASTIGYLISSVVNYCLSYSFTYRSAAAHRQSIPKYVIVNLCGLVLNGAVTYIGTAIYGIHYLVAQVAATIVTLLWNFFVNLRWTF
jgi:putative flippase GtrA